MQGTSRLPGSRPDGGTRGILRARGAGRCLRAPCAARRCPGQGWGARRGMQASTPRQGWGRRDSIPQRRSRPGAHRNQRFQCGGAALLPGSCRRCLRVSEVLGMMRRRRRMLRALIATPGLDQARQRAPALPAFLPCRSSSSPPAAGPSSRLWRCRGGRRGRVSDSRGLCPAAGGAQGQGQPAAGARRCPAGAGAGDPHQLPPAPGRGARALRGGGGGRCCCR